MRRVRHLGRARLTVVIGIAVVSLGIGSVGAAAPTTPSASNGSLTIALGAANPVFALPYLAQSLGYFKKAGLSVSFMENAGANTTNYVVSGQADLGMLGVAGPLLAAKAGKDTVIIYTHAAGGSGGVLVGSKSVTSISQVRGKRIGAIGIGSSTYGFANIYNQKFKLGGDIVPYADLPTVAAALASDQIAAATGAYDSYASVIAAGNAHLLVDTRTAKTRKAAGVPDYPEGAIFGLRPDIVSKQASIVAFIWALNQAHNWLNHHSDSQVAAELAKNTVFTTIPLTLLTSEVGWDRGYISPTGGRVPAATWKDALAFYGQWGVPGFDPSSPVFAYNQRINMGYLNAALRRGSNFKLLPMCKHGQHSTAKHPCRTS